jgi:type VI secretion system protein ImpC
MSEETATTTAIATTTEVSATGEPLDLKRFLSSMRLNPDISEPVPMLSNNLETVTENIRDEDRFISGMAAVLMNIDATAGKFDKGAV